MRTVLNEKIELLVAALKGIELGNEDLSHLSNLAAVSNYIRIADEIKNILKTGTILD